MGAAKRLVLAFLMVLAWSNCQSQELSPPLEPSSLVVTATNTGALDMKSEKTGRLLAIFPGFFLHGWGHYYAENYFTSGCLLGSELAGIALIKSYSASTVLRQQCMKMLHESVEALPRQLGPSVPHKHQASGQKSTSCHSPITTLFWNL